MQRATPKAAPLVLGLAVLLSACGGGSDSTTSEPAAPQGSSGTARAERLRLGEEVSAIATDLAQPGVGLDRAKLARLIALARNKNGAPEGPRSAQATMSSLNYIDGQNWYRRVFSSSADQNTPDRDGLVRFVDRQQRAGGGGVAHWSAGPDPHRQSDFHWNGSTWMQCGFNQEHRAAVRTTGATGFVAQYDYCDGLEVGSSVREWINVSGESMLEVYEAARSANATNLSIRGAAGVLGTAVFPEGSFLATHVNTPSQTAPAYYPGLGNAVRNARPGIAAGILPECLQVTFGQPVNTYTSYATTLESMVAGNRGSPCVFGPAFVPGPGGVPLHSGPRNEWWSQSTVGVAIVGTAAPSAGSYYTGNVMLRAGFGPGDTVTYYACQQRFEGSARNCDALGSGTFAVQQVGDARVMTLSNPPGPVAGLSFDRLFIERNGRVYGGYRGKPQQTSTARLNIVALNALAAQLGLPQVDAEVPLQPTRSSYQGEWLFAAAGGLASGDTVTVRLAPDGSSATCVHDLSNARPACTVSQLDAATGQFQMGTADTLVDGVLRLVEGTVTGVFNPIPGSTLVPGTLEGARR